MASSRQIALPLGGGHIPYQSHSRTSRDAADWQARSGVAANLEVRCLWLFSYAGQDGMTDEELDAQGERFDLGFKRTLRPRRVALWRRGYVDDSGWTRKTSTGRQATVWRITPEGLEQVGPGGKS